MAWTPRRLTRDEFTRFIVDEHVDICVDPPYVLAPCHCRDVNCRGWRFVELVELETEDVAEGCDGVEAAAS